MGLNSDQARELAAVLLGQRAGQVRCEVTGIQARLDTEARLCARIHAALAVIKARGWTNQQR
jgi:hypothetical protein